MRAPGAPLKRLVGCRITLEITKAPVLWLSRALLAFNRIPSLMLCREGSKPNMMYFFILLSLSLYWIINPHHLLPGLYVLHAVILYAHPTKIPYRVNDFFGST